MKNSHACFALGLVIALSSAGCYVEEGHRGPPPPPPPPTTNGEVVVESPPPPPAPPVEPAPPAPPTPGDQWVAGNYRWDGHQYQLQHGHYEHPPRANAHYVGGHWEERGHGRAWVDGHWE